MHGLMPTSSESAQVQESCIAESLTTAAVSIGVALPSAEGVQAAMAMEDAEDDDAGIHVILLFHPKNAGC